MAARPAAAAASASAGSKKALDLGSRSIKSNSTPDFRLVELSDTAPLTDGLSLPTVIDSMGSGSSASAHPYMPFSFARFLGLSLSALGVIYGDIGTSPLYAYSSMFTDSTGTYHQPSSEDAIGALSVIIWMILIVVCFKYIIFVMMADNHGEGGVFALAGLLMDSSRVPSLVRRVAIFAAMPGAALLIGDGMLTPAISVVSAIEGIQVNTPSISQDVVIIISVAIIFALFMVQRFGTHRIGLSFGPIMVLWFVAIAALGINNLSKYDTTVFKAFNPGEALSYFERRGFEGWASIGTAMLAVTGAEAMFADLGHFGASTIRFAWFCLPFPALLLNYLGQAAYVLQFPEHAESSFYSSMPSRVLWPMIVLATLATIIASQAIITGSFSIMRQAISNGVCPRLSIYFTNEAMAGQIYIPAINYILMFGTIALVAGFRKSASLSSAYGMGISLDFLITTSMLTVCMLFVWQWPVIVVMMVSLPLFALDSNMVGANMLKVPHGGWFPLVVAAVITLIQVVWKLGKEEVDSKTAKLEQTVPQLRDLLELDGNVVRPPIMAMYMCSSGDPLFVPHVLTEYLQRSQTVARICVFCHIKMNAHTPFCDPALRFHSETIDARLGLYRLTVNMGFAERSHGFYRMVTEYLKLQRSIPTCTTTLFVAGQHQVVSTRVLTNVFHSLSKFNNPLFDNLGIPPQQSLTVITGISL
eukprot:m.117881 g.117881  ORF g.117881 m.117881 type:complete len:700 (+) comp16107_c2_seq1:110-2209(+)